MKTIFQALLSLTFLWSTQANALSLRSGDILLQSNDCFLCNIIEAEEKSPYSHIGVLVLDHGAWKVLESWSSVRKTTLDEFLSHRKKSSQTLVLRLTSKNASSPMNAGRLLQRFENRFEGLSYDSQFLWNNGDTTGEKLYCSEFVAKFLAPFLLEMMATKPMHFDVNREFWLRYFHGNPPDGQPGISPGDFERSPLFRNVGFI